MEDSGLSYYAGINGNGDEIQLEKDDYAFTSIDVAKAVGRKGGFVKAQVQYKSAEDGSWKSAGTYTFSAQNTRVNLGSDNDKATAFRLIYDDASVKNGFTGGNITVNAVLYKRDIFKYDKEIISVKNTSSYEFDYSIYNETGSLEKHHSRSIKDALFNLDPTTIYPKAKIQKSAAVEGDKSIVQAGDKITYTLTLTNTGGENPIVNPVIIDQLHPKSD